MDKNAAAYQKTLNSQARSAEIGLHEYRTFQSTSRSQETASRGGQRPLMDSRLTNQMSSEREATMDFPAKAASRITVTTTSRSETSGAIPSSNVTLVPQYMKDALMCEGSELCFEEVRAQNFFQKLQEKLESKQTASREDKVRNQNRIDSLALEMKHILPCKVISQLGMGVNIILAVHFILLLRNINFIEQNGCPQLPVLPEHSQSWWLPTAPGSDTASSEQFHHASILAEQSKSLPQDTSGAGVRIPPESLDVLHASQEGSASVSHITPNNSLGLGHPTPSWVLPSPTVNTREALDVVMGMFQAPTLMEDPSNNISAFLAGGKPLDDEQATYGPALLADVSASQPFTVYQDDCDKENVTAAPPHAAHKSKPIRGLSELPLSEWKKTSVSEDSPQDKTPEETTMWGARDNVLSCLAACPNSTADFAMSAHCMSTPFTHKVPANIFQDEDNKCDGTEANENAFIRRQHKLSPIMEQSPSDDKPSEAASGELVASSASHCTIVGEPLSTTATADCHLTASTSTMMQLPPPAVLSFREQTLGPCDSSAPRTSGLHWGVSADPAPPADPTSVRGPFSILNNLEQANQKACDLLAASDWQPAPPTQPNLEAFPSPGRGLDVCMSPEPPCDVPMSPTPLTLHDEHMASPEKDSAPRTRLLSDPWSSDLISELLSRMSPPLSSHPQYISWRHSLPNITPKMSISVGNWSLRVDRVLGKGAFATVYQATNPESSEQMVLKVQKPSNPWEFYINTQLDARLTPHTRHLYSRVHSAHLFTNGSILMADLHHYGTLLNAINMYKQLGEKVMPQPLVIYFTICILRIMEELHAVRIIHADVKPDNFMLAHKFLENKFECENLEQGLVLIDLGQSIDMELFPEGTAFTARCLTSGFQCTEMLNGKPWNYQTDYFGIAGTVHCMLFGTYMQVVNEGGVWRTTAVFRRNPHSEMWLDLFHTLLNIPDCSPLASLSTLRHHLESVLQDNYSSKMASLKSRLVVLLLESIKAARR
ncbi:mitotic checkpoint serine/threonine-protein kinase BUB1 isoform X2 [Dunckerocampus dactyliophorus]|uniref:mitotic checkpoint serine/threonine-protein kinase BUB1 isoform X2 n=1 Tax=Dunckerocampus dactyliophorus TaxID=161453 RepID=UPI0024053E90|nr:mitotic checkpoint serine/threonine-protein kinase BUB1 isoform X2 [Dunckerocampus dactyliophorus]